jgi:alpha-beta hydrolase superfamily lysophospholipase
MEAERGRLGPINSAVVGCLVRLRVLRRLALGAALVFTVLNGLAYRQATAFTRFAPASARPWSEGLTMGAKARALLLGIDVPRPLNQRTPRDVGLAYERHVFTGGRGFALEAWHVACPMGRGTVLLFHGHAASKEDLLGEAAAFHAMRMSVLLVDFAGSGGSEGNETSIGFHEARDVSRAVAYARGLPAPGPLVLYGSSMGAAAILKGVADDGLDAAGLVLECPFDSLERTVRRRFTSRGLPSFLLADLLLYWGGVQQGFDAFAFRPSESAARVASPTLLLSGDRDPWVRPEDARAVFDSLRGPRTLKFLEGVGHDAGLRRRPAEWRAAVAAFLDGVLGSGGPPLDISRPRP